MIMKAKPQMYYYQYNSAHEIVQLASANLVQSRICHISNVLYEKGYTVEWYITHRAWNALTHIKLKHGGVVMNMKSLKSGC